MRDCLSGKTCATPKHIHEALLAADTATRPPLAEPFRSLSSLSSAITMTTGATAASAIAKSGSGWGSAVPSYGEANCGNELAAYVFFVSFVFLMSFLV